MRALDFLLQNLDTIGNAKIVFYMDSELVYSQISGLYKMKSPTLRELLFKVREKESRIKLPISYNHLPREKNKEADRLVNQALDNLI